MEDKSTTAPANARQITLKLLLTVFLSTFKIGLVTFGGGLAMLPLMQREFSEKHSWVSESDISDIIAVSQTLPGVIAINVSVMTAFRVAGTTTAVIAGIGCILPSFIILCVITLFYTAFIENDYVRGALRGVSGAVVALFISAFFKLFRKNLADLYAVGFFAISAALIFIFPSLNVIFIILGGGFCGFILYFLILRNRRKSDNE